MNDIPKTCLLCKHFHWTVGDYGYSEYTPGYDATMGCGEKKWDIDFYEDYEPTFRKKMLQAETCDAFEYSQYVLDALNENKEKADEG